MYTPILTCQRKKDREFWKRYFHQVRESEVSSFLSICCYSLFFSSYLLCFSFLPFVDMLCLSLLCWLLFCFSLIVLYIQPSITLETLLVSNLYFDRDLTLEIILVCVNWLPYTPCQTFLKDPAKIEMLKGYIGEALGHTFHCLSFSLFYLLSWESFCGFILGH